MTPVFHWFTPRQPAGSGVALARTHGGGGQTCEDILSMKACVIHLLGGEVDFSIYFEVQAAFWNNVLLVLLVFHTPSCVFCPSPICRSIRRGSLLFRYKQEGWCFSYTTTQIHQE